MFKLFVYAVFLYVLYRLLFGGRKKKVAKDSSRQGAGTDELIHDQLVEDPVCHIYIPKRQAIVLQTKETTVFFCSEKCRTIYCDAQTSDQRENG